MKRILRVLVLIAFPVLGFAQTPPPPSISLSVAIPQTVKVGSDIKVDITKKNISNQDIPVGISIGNTESAYPTTVLDSGGKPVKETEFGQKVHAKKARGGGSNGVVLGTLKPGATVQEFFFLNPLYDLTQPGNYTVQVQVIDPVTQGIVKSNIAPLTITP